jgi:mRNA-degrading endonuclease RelE of RelBE toxin-antitoxin system
VYTVKFASVVKSDVRKLDKQLQRIIKEEHLTSIEKTPSRLSHFFTNSKGFGLIILTVKERNTESYMRSIPKTKLF